MSKAILKRIAFLLKFSYGQFAKNQTLKDPQNAIFVRYGEIKKKSKSCITGNK